ncbi:LPD38 domain-containing protein [Megasphaera hexanoica]|uniref:LPD38 domain-containing protein n=1 Tax=Megasphaera hexanoica TaxID=1675036 RepID=A0ABW7DSR3_9FIRM|nr:LPD38 domain-containing protein [Megasphaera hexanoica]AXB82591.1 hypothetical protein ACT01_10310 [Megasphaera hexanoica]
MTLDDIIRNANGGKLASDTDNSNDTQPQEQSNPGLFDKISTFLSDAGQAYGNADNPGAEIYSQTPYADNLTNEVHDQNMADGQNIYTVLAPNYTPRPLDDSVYTDIPGTPVDLGTLEDESVRNARMQDSADYMAANWPRLYGAGAGAVENGANVVGGIQNALGLGDSTLQNAEQFEKGMQDYRKQWDATYGDNYFLNPNNFANDAGAVIGSTAPILALSAMTPGALVAGGSRALTGALSRAGLGRLAMSKAGQALIADTVRTLPSSSLADSLSEYGGVVHDLMQNGMSEDEARAQAVPIFYKNMALDTAVLPLELGIAKGGKGLITGLLKRNAGENIGKGLAKGTARTGILSGLSGITEGYQEGAQNALEDQTKGERDGGWYNPVTWTPEDWRSARAGFVGGALMGIPGNVATAYRPDTKQADLSPEAQTQVQDIKNTLMNDASYGNMDSDTYNSYLELANSGNPALIKLANDSLASWKEKQGISTDSTVSTDMTAGEDQTGPVNAEMEAEKDRIRQYLNDNTIEQMGGQKNYDWLYNTLNSTDPDEVHKAYQTAVESTAETQEQEAAQAEQQDEEQPTGNVSINSDNPFIGYVVKAANDQGIDPKIALAIAARESGGDDVNAIHMAKGGGLMQITEDSAGWYGVNDLYPDWRSDPEQNAEAGMYILKKKIEEAGGDTWAGVRGYNGAGEAADQYLTQIQQNYDNLGDIGGSSWSGGVSGYDLPTQSDEITAQVETLKPGWKQALPAIGGILNDMGLADGSAISSAGRTSAHNAEVGGAEHSYHINDDERGGGDAVDIVLPEGTTEEQAQAVLDRFKSTGAFKEVLFHDVGSGYHLHLGGYTGGLNGGTGRADSDMADIRRQQDAEDRAFDEQEREINDDSRAAMNRIMNDNSVENAFDETQRDTEAAKKQQEETLKTLTSGTQEEQPAQTPEIAQNQPQNGTDTTVDATAPIGQQTAITGANTATKTATKTVQQNQPVQTAQAQPIQTPAGTQDPRINKAIHDPAMLNLVTRAMNGDSVAKESVGNLNQNIVDAVQQHIIATALNAHQQRIAKAPAGKTETILSDDVKTEYPAQYKIVSADDITPSNNTDGSVNAFYPQQYQPRDRTRAGMRKQVEDMANNLNPSALGASNNANMGAPVINSQGVVLNGNGRTMALKSVYKGKPKQIKAYKDFLKQNAKSLGIDPATIDGVKNPVLVRQVADDAPVQDIINSKAGGSQMSAGETAKKDADRIKQSTLQLASDSGDLTQESNRKFVNSVLKDVASPEELNTLYTKTGKISQAGITRAKNALFAKAYGDDYLLTKMSESTDNNIRNVMNAMLTVAPKVAMLNDGMGKGLFYSYPLSDVISGSAKTLIGLREQNKPVKFYLEETSLISESENQDSINDVLRFIDRNKRSGKTITAFFNEICNEIELQGHPDQGALIASENPTMEEVINIAERKVENNGVQSLFDTGRSEGNQTDTASGRMADGVLPGTSAGTETNAGANGSERKEESTGKTESRPEVAKGEANEENTESNHVNTEPQQTESKDKESTHAEEGSQGDVQEEISKFHNVLDDEKSTPKQVIDAYKIVVDKAIANANGSRKNAKIGDKIVTDEYQYLTNSKHWDAFMNKDGGRNWHEVATINADAHKTLRTIIKTAGKETAPKAEQPKETKPTEQPKEKAAGGFTDDEIKTLTDRGFNRWTKKLSNGKVMDRLYIKPEYLGLELTRYKSGNISSAKFNGETISNSEARRIEGTKCYVDVATKEVVCDREDLKQAAQEVIDDALSKEKSQVLAQAKTKKAAPKDDFKLANGYRTESGSPLKEADKAEKGKKYSVREANGQLTRSKEDLKAEIKEAFPNAKEIKDEGERMTFTMPNGSHIVVDLKNKIILTDKELEQAKKDHHIDDNGNVVVEGYAEAHGKGAYIALAQGSREGTGFHEAYHIAEDAVLTDREKAAIKKAIPDAEERADKYAEWVEARKHGRGTAWGKLFQKIKDFAMKMKTILTGEENVHNVFRKIESGEVWERNANNSDQRASYSMYAKRKLKEDMQAFAKKIDDFMSGKLSSNDYVKVMDTPLVLNLIGEKMLPVYISPHVLDKVLHWKHGLEISPEVLKEIPRRIADPMFILKAIDNKGVEDISSKIVVIDLKDNNGATIMVPFVMEQKTRDGNKITGNIIKSVYGKTIGNDNNHPNNTWYINRLMRGDCIYINKKRTDHWLTGINTSARTPNGPLVVDSFNLSNIIADETDLGKLKEANPTHYSIRKPKDAAEEAREKAEQDAENTAVTLNDILMEARKIMPIYTKSKVGEKSPAKYHYDARQRAGFVPGSFDVGDIGSAIALHIDSIGEIKGANIELTKDIIEDRQMEQRNAKKYKSKVPPDISPSQARQEGVRNFGRLYFLDNERAKETYPQYYDLFEKALDGMPKEKAGVEKVLALQDQRVRQNPLLSAAAGISNGKPDSQLTWKERMKKRLLHLYAQMVDETDPIGQLTKALELETGAKIADEKDPHKRALMCNSVASARAFMLLDGDNRVANLKALNKVYKGAIKNKVVFADVIDKLGKVTKAELKKAEVKDAETLLSMYLIAARTEEIIENNKDYIRPDGYEHETCMRILVNAPQAIKDAATMFWKYNENLVNIIEQQGLITHAAAEGMRKYKKYCPMYRDFNEGDSVDTHIATINTGRGFINQTSGIKSLSGGSSRPVINPVDSMINMTTVLIGKCERNNVAKIMVQCAEDHGGLGNVIVRDPTLTGADRQRCAFTVIKAGKKVVYRTTPELYESITQMDTNSAAFMSNLFGKFTDALRFGATNTPSFMMRNFIRDTVTAGINSKYGFTPLVDSFRGMWKLTHDKQFKADFYAQGVPMDTYIRNDIRGAQDFKKKLRKDLKKYPFGIRQAMWFMSATAHKYNNVGELIEQGTRAGEFLKARKKGATEEEAGYAAREVSINFSRHGSVGKKINRYIPFFNASIQGIDKFIRTFKENPKRAIWATIKYIILPSLACWAFNHDDDWYKDLDPTTKYLNWCIHIPGTDTHFLIPKPQEVGVMFGSGIEAVLNQFLADDPKAMKQWAWELAGVMTPGLAVTMIRPFFEWQRNYSLWTNHNLVPKRLEKLPSEQQYTNSTSELAKLLGDTWIAKNISVGDRHGISPIAIDNFFSAWFGSMGRTLAKTLDKPIESLRGKDRPTEPAKYWYESPVIGSFVRNDDSQRSAYVDRLYDLSDQMETDYKRSDSYAVQKGKKGAKVPTELAQVRTAMKTVSKLNKEIRDIQDNPKMSAEEKRTQIDTRKVKMRGIAKKAVLKLGD